MNIYRSEKGVTLIVLVVSMLVMGIIAGVGVYQGAKSVTTSKDSKLMSEVGIVQHAVLEQYVKYKTTKNEAYLIGTKIEKSSVVQIATEMGISLVNIPTTYANAEYYKLTASDVQKLGFENAKDEFIVNYVSGEVINYTNRKDSKGNPVYVKADTFDGR